MFFVGPSVADVDGDNYPEVIIGSGGYYVHAWNGCGEEAAGWPKFTGGWVTSSVAVGDIDGDGLNEAAVTTRAGYLFVWNLESAVATSQPWPEYRHDNHNTGNYDMPLSNGAQARLAPSPLECVIPVPDAGMADGGIPPVGGGGCNCSVAAAPGLPTAGPGSSSWASRSGCGGRRRS